MNPKVTDALFAALRAALHGTTVELRLTDAEWDELFLLCANQGVIAVARDGMDENLMPRKAKFAWALSVEKIERKSKRIASVAEKLCAFYAQHNIEMVILKGLTVAQHYPTPSHRESGDIDIYLCGAHDKGNELVNSTFGSPIHEANGDHHSSFILDGVLVENHEAFTHKRDKASLAAMHRLFDNPEGDRTTFHALFLMCHMARHFAQVGINMRPVIDWAIYKQRNANSINTNDLYAAIERLHLRDFALCIDSIAASELGLGTQPTPQPNAAMRDRILADILSHRKDNLRHLHQKVARFFSGYWRYRLIFGTNIVTAFYRRTHDYLRDR